MGDLNGADEQMVGDIFALSFARVGNNQEISYQPLATIRFMQFPWLGLFLLSLVIPTS